MDNLNNPALIGFAAQLVLVVIVAIFAAAWLFLPFKIIGALNRLHQEAKAQTAQLELLASYAKRAAAKDAAQKMP